MRPWEQLPQTLGALIAIWQEIQNFASIIENPYFSAQLDLQQDMFHLIYSICVDFILDSQEMIVQKTKKWPKWLKSLAQVFFKRDFARLFFIAHLASCLEIVVRLDPLDFKVSSYWRTGSLFWAVAVALQH